MPRPDRRDKPPGSLYPPGMFARPLLAFALLVLPAATAVPDEPRPNVLLIFSDDQGINDVGCYGGEIPTPALDSLAAQGLKFEQFYAASSICTPSRFGLLTGRFAHRSVDGLTGALMFLDPADADRGIRPGETTFVSLLKQAGYRTHLVGKWHLGHGAHGRADPRFWPTEHGFDTFFGHTGGCVDFFTCRYGDVPDWFRGDELIPTDAYATDVITDEAAALLRRSGAGGDEDGDGSEPWFLQVSYNAPHFGKGWDAEERTATNVMQPKPADLARVDSLESSDPAVPDPLRRAFAAKVIGMDAGIGRLLATLEETGQAENTLVIFMSDHGGDPDYGGSNLPLRGEKATLYEGGVRVPCLARWPGVIEPGATTGAVASALDWFPTFADLGLIEPPAEVAAGLDGQSLAPLLRGGPMPDHKPIVWATGSHAELNRASWVAVRAGDWKWVRHKGAEELFDLAADPAETTNLAAERPEVAARLREAAARSGR